MQRDDDVYFEQRAQEELELAQQATTAEATEAHYRLANLYLERVHTDASAEPADDAAQEGERAAS